MEDKGCFWIVAAIIGGLIILFALSAIFGLFGLGWDRVTSPIREETRAQTYDSSRQYQQGTNRDLAQYCHEMATAPNDAAKKAVAGLIRSTVSTYNGPLNDDNSKCVTQAKGM